MSTDPLIETMMMMADYRSVIRKQAPYLNEFEVTCAANVLRGLEEDPFNCKDYKSVAIAINEARGE